MLSPESAYVQLSMGLCGNSLVPRLSFMIFALGGPGMGNIRCDVIFSQRGCVHGDTFHHSRMPVAMQIVACRES